MKTLKLDVELCGMNNTLMFVEDGKYNLQSCLSREGLTAENFVEDVKFLAKLKSENEEEYNEWLKRTILSYAQKLANCADVAVDWSIERNLEIR